MKYFISILSVCAFLPGLLFAGTKNIHFSSYDEASKANEYIKYDMKSSKFGLVRSKFTGFVTDAAISYEETPSEYKSIMVSFNVKDIDTDIKARNKKMWNKCFSADKFPRIIVEINHIKKSTLEQEVDADIEIRGEKFTISILVDQKDGKLQGESLMSLQSLKIPDPSILVAKVLDAIDVSFSLHI